MLVKQVNDDGESAGASSAFRMIELGDALKRTSLYTGRFALTGVAAAALWLTVPDASALGLGRLAVQSALGETLRAEIDITSLTPEEASNMRVRVAPPESYRAAGVDYNSVLPGTQAVLLRRPDGHPYFKLTSDRPVQEPFVDVILEISWSTGRLVREYTLLFDPPTVARAPAPSTAPIATAPPPPAPAPAPAPAPSVAAAPPPAAEPSPAPAAAPAPAPRTAERRPAASKPTSAPSEVVAKPASPGVDEYRVRSGDTLSRIASQTQRSGVSLDQMLVSLYRGNPQAFIESNMNRLKAGAVLAVPSAETAKATAPSEARELIQAQSADFGAYRQKLAGAVPAAKTEAPTRQAGGKVQANVEDRKQAAAPTPDKLTLSKGAGAKASAPEERLSKEREKKDAATRVAELSKNVEELKKLSGAASAAVKPGAPAVTAAPPAATKPGVVVTPPPAVAVAPPPPTPAPARAPASTPAVVVPPTVVAKPAAPPASAAVAAAPAASPVVVSAKPAASAAAVASAASRPVVPVSAEEPGIFGSLLDDNPLALALGAAVVALLAGFGIYRFARRSKSDSGETSFLESRLQPDSFFGASGGQRIDTRDASGASSSMSYSLSQLDAIGDVDPVAEADVYLAYGRDLQAEEILKEAMRGNPERMAIRTKLLEVYAKRRDTKGFEQLATQLFALTRGEGEDWAKAQELGSQIDPDNPLYRPGGAPLVSEAQRLAEPLGASTMPQSILPSGSQFDLAQAEPARADASAVDLDLELDDVGASAPVPLMNTQTLPREAFSAPPAPSVSAVPELPPIPPAPARPPVAKPATAPAAEFPMDFDLSAISLDLEPPKNAAPAAVAESGVGDLAEIDFAPEEDDGSDPLARKLELAEEFRQIGDMEGARDLLQEVVAKADGVLKSKAQGMLDALA